MAFKFGPQSVAIEKTLLPYGVLSYRTWERGFLDIAINGYLLEPREDEKGKITYHPLLVSVLGLKRDTEMFIDRMIKFDGHVLFPCTGETTVNKHRGYMVRGFFYGEPPIANALEVESQQIQGTVWWQKIAYRKDLLKTTYDQDTGTIKAYLLGVDLADADLGFERLLRESSVPFIPVWLPLLKAEIKKQPKWATKLRGHQMTGWSIRIPRKELFGLLQNLAREGKLPLPAVISQSEAV